MIRRQDEIIKVLVVDDSAFMRKVITDILNSDDGIKVVGTAVNGKEAIEKADLLKPDVITLDVEMPVMDGLICLEELLKPRYTPIVMLSSVTKEGADATLKALEIGAVDFITKPANIFMISSEDKVHEIIEKVRIAWKSTKSKKVIQGEPYKPKEPKKKETIEQSNLIKYIVAIGTSTGGPKALQDVIPLIPGDVPAAFLVVQHMPPGFTKSLADRLNGLSEVTVKEAEQGDIIKPGFVYLAPGDYHMLIERTSGEGLRIKLSQDPPVGGHRPAVNVMMESLSKTGQSNLIGVIMTGMGGDGSDGVKIIKEKNNGYIIAQDESSCVVFGMPKVAIKTGAVDEVVPLKEITKTIMKIVGVHK